ncbi:D-aminoacyl-tRNA deacylase [Salinicola rhizosphaerae]|uniref:D-aminoacyl-tRNA deacylase n=1 Tax=Salinicola rhizosphaerae TaxID=1443141 RepID=A0ABQ3DQV7_9GAMM|nr:D-aminoacyl-tRNA deacylase [Salinicola rhizosphaerae]GHB12485.1 D-aminoacyl-tRNA deacylase [Salinicola rhizosphaerae]
MRALIQRVSQAAVHVDDERVGGIDHGILALIGVEAGDDTARADRLLQKLLNYRIFADDDGRMNCSLKQVDGGLLLVSQFTLVASTTKGLRPSFSSAASPEHGRAIYDHLVTAAKATWTNVATGRFGANMQVSLTNDGPVTFLLET